MSDDQGGGGQGGGSGGRGWFVGMGRGNFQIQGLNQAVQTIGQLNTTMQSLTTTLTSFSQNQQKLASGMTNMFNQISSGANQAAAAVNNANQAVNQAQATVANTGSGSGVFSSMFSKAASLGGNDLIKDLAMFPLRYMTGAIGTNRQLGMNISAALGSQMYATGATAAGTAQTLARFPGNVMGSPDDLIGLLQVARQSGAFLDLNQAASGGNQSSARTVGFLQAVSEAQKITPATPAAQIAATIGGYSGNVQAQQQSAFLTGGAFSMLAAGGRHRSLQEWADSIMQWMVDQRPGGDRGKPFTYPQLLSQYFPGSNMDAWLTANGVSEGMKEYWWDYVLAKSRTTAASGGANGFGIVPANATAAGGGNQAWERLQSVTAQTRGQFQMAGKMAGTYSNQEQANRWWNEMMGQVNADLIPKQVSGGPLSALQYMPDAMQELLMTFLERSGPLGAAVGGGLGYGITGIQSLIKNMMGMVGSTAPGLTNIGLGGLSDLFGGAFRVGGGIADSLGQLFSKLNLNDVGDIGDADYGSTGHTTPAGMNLDFRKKVSAMMRANPRIKLNSGVRDTVIQQNLKSRTGQTSGQSSAHTRGRAADLGPRSEYPWIVANARKFGLASGVNHGEPWHVGMRGDIPTHGDIGDTTAITGGLGSLWGLLTGTLSKENVIEGIGATLPTLMNLFFGLFGMGENSDPSRLAYDPDVYGSLRSAGQYQTGGKFGSTGLTYGTSFWGSLFPGGNNNNSTNNSSIAPTTTLLDAAKALGLPATGSAGALVARIAHAVGFNGPALQTIVAIAKRESNWDPTQHNTNSGTGDNSYGLTQINMIGKLGPSRRAAYGLSSDDQLLDPYINLRTAWQMSSSGTDFDPWLGYRAGLSIKAQSDDARKAIQEAGLGDIEGSAAAASMRGSASHLNFSPTTTNHSQMVFNNNFVLQGGGGSGANTGMGGSLDARRTAVVLADHLETEMRRRTARKN